MTALWAVLPAAGSASRMGGDRPKQFVEIEGRSLLAWSIRALREAADLEGVIAALPADCDPADLGDVFDGHRVRACRGGATRAASVSAGLEALAAADEDWVLVHDAARPCLPAGDVRRLVSRVLTSGVGAILARPVTDTLKRADEQGRVTGTVSREGLWRALTPQMFRVGELRAALHAASHDDRSITDEASAMERAGFPVGLVEGSAANIKITFPEDLERAALWLSQQYARQV